MLTAVRTGIALLMVSLLLPAAGCVRTGYYLQSVRGQLDLMSKRVDIEEMLEDPDTPSRLRARLISVTEMRDFASAELGLPDNRSYRSYADLERPYVVWNVFAAPELSVEPETWCFLFVGCISYRGYFDEQKAREFAAGLAAKGMDVYVAGIAAYSTLGRFADPVLNTMLAGDDVYMAGLIFHELSHQQVYIKNATVFNESFATMVEEEGLRRWLASRNDDEAWSRWQRRTERAGQFNAVVGETREQLHELYASDLDAAEKRERKAGIIASLRAEHDRLKQQWGGYSGYERWFEGPLNNAQLSSVATYQLLVPAFRALLQQTEGDLIEFYRRVSDLGELPAEERERVLKDLAADSG